MFAPFQETLESLNIRKWLSRLTDYVHITGIREVPKNIKEYVFLGEFKQRVVIPD